MALQRKLFVVNVPKHLALELIEYLACVALYQNFWDLDLPGVVIFCMLSTVSCGVIYLFSRMKAEFVCCTERNIIRAVTRKHNEKTWMRIYKIFWFILLYIRGISKVWQWTTGKVRLVRDLMLSWKLEVKVVILSVATYTVKSTQPFWHTETKEYMRMLSLPLLARKGATATAKRQYGVVTLLAMYIKNSARRAASFPWRRNMEKKCLAYKKGFPRWVHLFILNICLWRGPHLKFSFDLESWIRYVNHLFIDIVKVLARPPQSFTAVQILLTTLR